MGKINFMMDTQGHCFICTKPVNATETEANPVPNNPGHGLGGHHEHVVSFQHLANFLQIDLGEVSREATPLAFSSGSKSKPFLIGSELKGLLCGECIPLFKQFTEHYEEMERKKRMIADGAKLVCQMMTGDKAVEGRIHEVLGGQTESHFFVKHLRAKTIEKLAAMGRGVLASPQQDIVFVDEITPVESGEQVQGPSSTLTTDNNGQGGGDGSIEFKCHHCNRKYRHRFLKERHQRECPQEPRRKPEKTAPPALEGPSYNDMDKNLDAE